MAIQTTWIAMATVLSIYDIKKAVGPDGKPIEPSHETSSSILLCVFILISRVATRIDSTSLTFIRCLDFPNLFNARSPYAQLLRHCTQS